MPSNNKTLFRGIVLPTLLGILAVTGAQASELETLEIASASPKDVAKAIVAPFVRTSKFHFEMDEGYKNIGSWKVSDLYDLHAGYGCSVVRNMVSWPALGECGSSFRASIDRERFEAYQAKELENEKRKHTDPENAQIAIGNLRLRHFLQVKAFDRSGWTGYGATKVADDVFENVSNPGHVISLNGTIYSLENFDALAKDAMLVAKAGTQAEIDRERRKIALFAVLGVLGLVASFYFLAWLVRFVRRLAKEGKARAQQLKDAAAGQVDKLQAAHQQRKVRSVMVDETIREMTRSALSGADAKSKEVLIGELRKAIESGNHELANALELALKKA